MAGILSIPIKAPVLIVQKNNIPETINEALHNLKVKSIYIVGGEKLPDALCASGYMSENDAVIMLTPKNNVHESIYNFLNNNKVNRGVIVGGPDSVSMVVDETLDNYDIYR